VDPRAGRRLHPRQIGVPGEILIELLEYAREEFKADALVGDDGAPMGAHLRKIEERRQRTGQKPLQERSEPPEETAYLWEAFLDLHGARSGNGFGPNPIGFQEIEAWERSRGVSLNVWEWDTLRLLDRVWLKEFSDARPRRTDSRSRQPRAR
jgi:hypothetical protein